MTLRAGIIDLNAPPLISIAPLYAEMRRMGGEVEFRTFCETPEFYEAAIAYGVGLGASSIELWQNFNGFPHESREKLKRWASFFDAEHVRCRQVRP